MTDEPALLYPFDESTHSMMYNTLQCHADHPTDTREQRKHDYNTLDIEGRHRFVECRFNIDMSISMLVLCCVMMPKSGCVKPCHYDKQTWIKNSNDWLEQIMA